MCSCDLAVVLPRTPMQDRHSYSRVTYRNINSVNSGYDQIDTSRDVPFHHTIIFHKQEGSTEQVYVHSRPK